MSDYHFHRYYQDIKGSDWPEVDTYADFVQLPNWIQKEAKDIHKLDETLSQIEDVNFWRKKSSQFTVYKKENVVYFPVYKCASSYYKDFFLSQGWNETNIYDLEIKELQVFGLIMHPLTRRIKGITQMLEETFDNNYDLAYDFITKEHNKEFCKNIIVMAAISMPYNITYGSLLNQIHWIPMELFSDKDLQKNIYNFCSKNGVEIKLSDNITRINQSVDARIKLNEKVKEIFLDREDRLSDFYIMFADDLKFYHSLLRKYTNSNTIN